MRQILYALAALFLSALSALAEEFPAQYAVTGVADDDVLNIRQGPSASDQIIGELGPYAFNIEVLETTSDGRWGKVPMPEGIGWVAMRFMEPVGQDDPFTIPRPMTCVGTEPFWSLGLYPRGDEYSAMETGRRDLTLLTERVAENGYFAQFEEGPTLNRTLIIRKEQCGDGMSDREFGFSAFLFNDAPDGSDVQRGCCTLDSR